jgi:hypothetical protein
MADWHCNLCGDSVADVDLQTCPKVRCDRCGIDRPTHADDYDPADDDLPGWGG